MQARPQLSTSETLFAAELSPRWGSSRRQTAHPDLGLSPNRLLALIPGIRWSASIDSHAAVALCLDNSGSHWCSFIFCILLALPMHTLSSGRVRFGAFEPDLSIGELRSIEAQDPNHKVLLREQVFQVLRMLVEREGKIVTREEIKSSLWANDTIVNFDHTINATIKAPTPSPRGFSGGASVCRDLGRENRNKSEMALGPVLSGWQMDLLQERGISRVAVQVL